MQMATLQRHLLVGTQIAYKEPLSSKLSTGSLSSQRLNTPGITRLLLRGISKERAVMSLREKRCNKHDIFTGTCKYISVWKNGSEETRAM